MKSTVLRFSPRRISRSLRRALTRDHFLEAAKTFAWVAPLTVLIWIYAEQEQIKEDPDVSIPISIHMDSSQRVVQLLKPYPEKVVVAKLSGSRADLDSLESKLQRGANGDLAVEIPIDPNLDPSVEHPIVTAAALAKVSPFRQSGVTISYCQPESLVVHVEDVREEDVAVQVSPEAMNVVEQSTFSPAMVRVRGPENVFKAAKEAGKLVAYADLSGLSALKMPGKHDVTGVRIMPLEDKYRSLTFAPLEVKARLSVRENNISYTFPSLFVWVVGSADTMAGYRVDCTTSVPNVTIVGPPDKIDLVSRPDFTPKIRALLEVRPSDDHDVKLQRQVKIDLPPDMGLHVKDEAAIRPVEFQLIKSRSSE